MLDNQWTQSLAEVSRRTAQHWSLLQRIGDARPESRASPLPIEIGSLDEPIGRSRSCSRGRRRLLGLFFLFLLLILFVQLNGLFLGFVSLFLEGCLFVGLAVHL